MKVAAIIVIVCFIPFILVAQEKDHKNSQLLESKEKLILNIGRSFTEYSSVYGHYSEFFKEKYKNRAFAFGFAIVIDSVGKVERLIVTNHSRELDSIVNFKYIEDHLKRDKYNSFKDFKNSVVVSMGVLDRSWDKSIDNKKDYIWSHRTLIPEIDEVQNNKKVVLIPAIIMTVQDGQR